MASLALLKRGHFLGARIHRTGYPGLRSQFYAIQLRLVPYLISLHVGMCQSSLDR